MPDLEKNHGIMPSHELETHRDSTSEGPEVELEQYRQKSSQLAELTKTKSFELIKSIVGDNKVSFFNPDKSLGDIMEAPVKPNELDDLEGNVEALIELLANTDDAKSISEESKNMVEDNKRLFNKNVKNVLKQLRPLEKNYQILNTFFLNAGDAKINLINASLDQVTGTVDGVALTENTVISEIEQEIKNRYHRLSLKKTYSFLLIPGFLGGKDVVNTYAEMAYKHELQLITDYRDRRKDANDLFEYLDGDNIADAKPFLSNAIMTANYLVRRRKYDNYEEEEDLILPPSGALAGMMYALPPEQVAAGSEYGEVKGFDGVCIDLLDYELSRLRDLHVVPFHYEEGWNKKVSMSERPLYNGDDKSKKNYTTVRVYDYLSKVLKDFLNRNLFQKFTPDNQNSLRDKVDKFLQSKTGSDNLIAGAKPCTLKKIDDTSWEIEVSITTHQTVSGFNIKFTREETEEGDKRWEK